MTKFMADHMLKRSCEWLRIMGYDTSYPDCRYDNDILKKCILNDMVLLTRDYEFYRRYNKSIYIDSVNFIDQLREVIGMFPPDPSKFFNRCPKCNTVMVNVSSDRLGSGYESVRQRFKTVKYCPNCGQYFWNGSHYEKIMAQLSLILKR
ncbi:MAG: Mut7-C RNAse domain-containing protein [Ferroplasma sp.]